MTKRWKPKKGEQYFAVAADATVEENTWRDDWCDRSLHSSGNCFRTEAEAELASKKFKDLLLSLHGESVTDCSQLPKLTTEVFNRPDCPKWAKYAAVSEAGIASYYEEVPYLDIHYFVCRKGNTWIVGDCFDSSDWKNSLIERPGKKTKLPKLTVEVFNRPDCPKWARYAVVNSKGTLIFFGNKPTFEGEDYGCWSCSFCPYKHIRSIVFDASDWQNSLIERPVKETKLPYWLKVDAIGWCERYGYFKVIDIDKYSEGVYVQRVDDKSKGYLPFRTVRSEVVHADSHPYNEAEMKSLVGKTITMPDGAVCLCTAYNKRAKAVIFDNMHWDAQELMDSGCTIDGKPCFVLERLNEKGEWVE